MQFKHNQHIDTLIDTCPAFNYYTRAKRLTLEGIEVAEFKAEEHIAIKYNETDKFYRHYTIGSVVSYAIKRNKDPIEYYETAKKYNHETHYIFANGSILSADKREKEDYIVVTFNQLIKFEGRYFTIVPADNFNLKLIDVTNEQINKGE